MKPTVSLADVAAEPAAMVDDELPTEAAGEELDAAVGELADVLGIPEDKFERLRAALQAVILTAK